MQMINMSVYDLFFNLKEGKSLMAKLKMVPSIKTSTLFIMFSCDTSHWSLEA